MIGGRVLDVSAVLDLAGGESVYGEALLVAATEQGITLAVPAVALQAAWRASAIEGRPWLDLLPSLPTVVILPLGGAEARDAGLLAAGHQEASLGTAHAVQVARRRNWPVITAEVSAVLELDPPRVVRVASLGRRAEG